jgi:hypothetical protein
MYAWFKEDPFFSNRRFVAFLQCVSLACVIALYGGLLFLYMVKLLENFEKNTIGKRALGLFIAGLLWSPVFFLNYKWREIAFRNSTLQEAFALGLIWAVFSTTIAFGKTLIDWTLECLPDGRKRRLSRRQRERLERDSLKAAHNDSSPCRTTGPDRRTAK